MDTSVLYTPGMSLEQLEKQAILKCYHYNQNNKTATAASLGISVRTLDNKFVKYKEDETIELKHTDDRAAKRARLLAEARGFAPAQEEQAVKRDDGGDSTPGLEEEPVADQPEPKQELPVQQRQEVQIVLPRQVTNLGNAKRG